MYQALLNALCAPVVVRGESFPPGGIRKCLEMYLVVVSGKELLLPPSGRDQGCLLKILQCLEQPSGGGGREMT